MMRSHGFIPGASQCWVSSKTTPVVYSKITHSISINYRGLRIQSKSAEKKPCCYTCGLIMEKRKEELLGHWPNTADCFLTISLTSANCAESNTPFTWRFKWKHHFCVFIDKYTDIRVDRQWSWITAAGDSTIKLPSPRRIWAGSHVTPEAVTAVTAHLLTNVNYLPWLWHAYTVSQVFIKLQFPVYMDKEHFQ